MRTLKRVPVILSLISVSLFASSTTVSESQLLGTWVAVQRSLGGLGSMCTFLAGGKLEESFGAIVEGWYKIDGDKLIEPSGTTLPDAKPSVMHLRIEGNTLYRRPEKGSDETALIRVGKPEAGAAAIVGVWRKERQVRPADILEQERKAGRRIDERMAKAMADLDNREFHEFTRDGLHKFRLPMRTTPGTYDIASQTIRLTSAGNLRFRLDSGLLVLIDGQDEFKYIRADATKGELKRAGVRYGQKPAELDPP